MPWHVRSASLVFYDIMTVSSYTTTLLNIFIDRWGVRGPEKEQMFNCKVGAFDSLAGVCVCDDAGAFRLYDRDGDGYISRKDMMLVVTAIYQMIGSMLDMPIEENTPDKRVEKLFRQMDIVSWFHMVTFSLSKHTYYLCYFLQSQQLVISGLFLAVYDTIVRI